MDKYEAVERVLEIREQMMELIYEARSLAAEFIGSDIHGYDAYVFDALKEHLSKSNRYNQDLEDVANAIENSPDPDEQEDEDDQEEDLDDEQYIKRRTQKFLSGRS